MEEHISMMSTLELRTAAPFNKLFPIKDAILDEIAADMKANGYDYAHPIIVWAGHKVTVVDGHTRLKAALKIGLSKVPITLKEFSSEDEALQYAIRSQSNRRNLTDAELLSCLNELDKRKALGRPGKVASVEAAFKGKLAERTAQLLGVSRAKVERLRTVNEHAPEKIKEAVGAGEMSIRKAYDETMKARRSAETNDDNPSTEEWSKIKEDRKQAIMKSVAGLVRSRLEREVQEYPEIRYTRQELNEMGIRLADEIGKLIATMLPGDPENEQ